MKSKKEELLKSSKLNWHNQDIERLIRNTFSEFSPFTNLERTLPRAQEAEILNKLNNIVEEIAGQEKINTTLFFSKKSQKDFLRLVLAEGLDFACDEITFWRRKLIKEPMLNLLR